MFKKKQILFSDFMTWTKHDGKVDISAVANAGSRTTYHP